MILISPCTLSFRSFIFIINHHALLRIQNDFYFVRDSSQDYEYVHKIYTNKQINANTYACTHVRTYVRSNQRCENMMEVVYVGGVNRASGISGLSSTTYSKE